MNIENILLIVALCYLVIGYLVIFWCSCLYPLLIHCGCGDKIKVKTVNIPTSTVNKTEERTHAVQIVKPLSGLNKVVFQATNIHTIPSNRFSVHV